MNKNNKKMKMNSKSQLEQASSLFVMNQRTQMLDIFVNNDTFHDFSMSMLKKEGCLVESVIHGFEMVNDQTLRLIVGNLEGTQGSLSINAKAFTESQNDLTVDINLKEPEIIINQINEINEETTSLSFWSNLFLDYQPQLSFSFGGVLEGLELISYEWNVCFCELKLRGKPNAGTATLKVDGLFEADSEFRVIVSNSSIGLLDIERDIETAVSIEPRNIISLDNDASSAGLVTKMAENTNKAVTSMSVLSDISTVMSIVGSTFTVIKSMDDLFKWGIFPNPNEKFNEELGKINSKLDKLDSKIDEIHDAVKANMQLMIAGFNDLKYDIMKTIMEEKIVLIDSFLKNYNDIISTLSGDNRDKEVDDLISLKGMRSVLIINSIKILLKNLDPYGKNGENYDSLTSKYFYKVSSGLPFYHTTANMLFEYIKDWTAIFVKYSVITGLIYKNNIRINPESTPLYLKQMNDLLDDIKKVSNNISKYVTDKGALYFDANDNLVRHDFDRDSFNYSYENKGSGILLVLNRSGKQFFFDNIGNQVAIPMPYPGSIFLKRLVLDEIYFNTDNEKKVKTELFSGPNSILEIYEKGLSFNNFMTKYINSDKAAWLNPKNIIIESYEYKGSTKQQNYELALVADANVENYRTKKIKSSDCLNDYKGTYARVFCLNGVYEISKKSYAEPNYVKNLCFAVESKQDKALEKMKKISSEIDSVIETVSPTIDKKKERLYIGYSRTKDRKEAITDLFIYSTKESNAPNEIVIEEVKYQKLDALLNDGDYSGYPKLWLYYTKDQTAGFPVRNFITSHIRNIPWHEIKTDKGAITVFTRINESIVPRYLYCKR